MIKLNERDLSIIQDTANFCGLTLDSICQVHFDGSTYAWKRMSKLFDNGYLCRQYYYELNSTKKGKYPERKSAIYYPSKIGLNAINSKIDPRFVVPKHFDVNYLVSKLYEKIPGLLSKRQAIRKYNLKGFMPFTCVVPLQTPIFISVIKEKPYYGEVNKTVTFAKAKIQEGRYFIVSRKFPGKKFFDSFAYFFRWDNALEVIPNVYNCQNYYRDLFNSIMLSTIPGTVISGFDEPFTIIQTKNGEKIRTAELFTGFSGLYFQLHYPSKNTYVYVPDKRFIARPKEGCSYSVYCQYDKKFYRVYKKNDQLKMDNFVPSINNT